MRKRRFAIILALIIFLAAILRFYQITVNPPGLNSDEVAIGYNAYSILKTGRDEYNQFFPLAFRSFDDYKPPLYIYLTVPSVAIFGLNEFAVRFPSALLGVVAVWFTYLLAKELFSKEKIALSAALLLAISPWHIQFTRTAYETGSQAFFTALGLFFLLKGKTRASFLILSGIVFALETYLYQASRIFVPLFLFGTGLLIFRKEFRKLVLLFGVFGVIFLPNVWVMLSPAGLIRFQGTSVFQDHGPKGRTEVYQKADWLRNDNKSVILFHQPFFSYFQSIFVGYLSHFRPDFLVGDSGSPKIAYVPQIGLLYFWELPFLLWGLHYLLSRKNLQATAVLIFWILLSPLPASVASPVPSSIRTAIMLPALPVVTAVGLSQFFARYRIGSLILGLVVVYTVAFYLHMLLIHAPQANSRNWYFGYKDMVTTTWSLASKYDKIIVSSKLDEPQVFFLFFLKYDPAKYQASGGTVSGGFAEDRNRLEKIAFRPIDWETDRHLKKTLLVGQPIDFPPEAHVFKTQSNLDGTMSVAFVDEKK